MNNKGSNQKKGPDASRYDIRSELTDKSGFKVVGINHVFKYDQHGGWHDEYGNYYDKDNKPAKLPTLVVKEEEHKTSKQSTKEANPKRFENFTLLPDETGFKVQGTDHIFYFDIYGGWFDEFDNYYDADANPCSPPDYSEEDEHPADRLVNEYEDGSDEERDELAHYDNIYYNVENKKALLAYGKDQDIHVQVKNLPFKATEDDFEKFLVENKIAWLKFEFELNENDKFNGTCYIDFDKPQAEKFIELNGHPFQGRDMKIVILPPSEEEEADEVASEGEEEEAEAEGGH